MFKPKRGIRQGDPLSPYLFILCADMLSGLITKYHNQNKIHGITIAKDAPTLSHLFFADDSMVFCRANKSEARNLMDIFDKYQRISSQKLNLNKSEMVFNPTLLQIIKTEFQQFMPIQITSNINKYLGLPTQVGRSKTQVFNFLMERIRKKLKGWKEKNLSFLGRGVLIRAVIQAIPTYVMSTFLISQGICDRIEKAICRFWWGGNEDKRMIHWKNKEALFKSKLNGGQGFRTMRSFNEALLAKQFWLLLKNPNSLISRCLKAKYYPHIDLLKARMGYNPSFVWSSIYHAKWIIQKGGCWKIGDGSDVKVWEDNWIPQHNGFKIYTPVISSSTIRHVKDLIVEDLKGWHQPLLETHFHNFESEHIQQLPLVQEVSEDSYMWMFSQDENYTVKYGYNFIQDWHSNQLPGPSSNNTNQGIWKTIWSLNTIPRHEDFLWLVLNDAISVRKALHSKGLTRDMFCTRCDTKIESMSHTFMDCPFARKVWFGSNINIKLPKVPEFEFQDWLRNMFQTTNAEILIYISSVIYNLWYARNMLIFEDVNNSEKDILNIISKTIKDYMICNDINNKQNSMQQSNSRNHNQQQRAKMNGWKKPENNIYKVNTDANLSEKNSGV